MMLVRAAAQLLLLLLLMMISNCLMPFKQLQVEPVQGWGLWAVVGGGGGGGELATSVPLFQSDTFQHQYCGA